MRCITYIVGDSGSEHNTVIGGEGQLSPKTIEATRRKLAYEHRLKETDVVILKVVDVEMGR